MTMMNNNFRHTLLISQRFVIRQTRLAAAAAGTTVAAAAAAFAFHGKHFFRAVTKQPLKQEYSIENIHLLSLGKLIEKYLFIYQTQVALAFNYEKYLICGTNCTALAYTKIDL